MVFCALQPFFFQFSYYRLLAVSFTSPSPSKQNKDGKGGARTCQLYFDYDADKAGTGNFYTDPELKTKLKDYIGENEVILKVSYFKHPLYPTQVTAALMHHAFVVFETDHQWWSIEKNDELARESQFKEQRRRQMCGTSTDKNNAPRIGGTRLPRQPWSQRCKAAGKRYRTSSTSFGPKISLIRSTAGSQGTATVKALPVLSGVGSNCLRYPH